MANINGVTIYKASMGRISGSTQEKTGVYFDLVVEAISRRFKPLETLRDVYCELSFVIDKTGAIRDITVKRSTGTPAWDQWAIDAVKQTALPPLYDNIKADEIPVTITFDYGP